MIPYYQDDWTMIYHADCRDLLPHLEPVDLLVSDVAYDGISGGNTTSKKRCSGILKVNDGKIFKHNDIAPAEYAGLFYAALKSPAHCYVMTNLLNLEDMLREFRLAGFGLHNQLPWVKDNAVTNRWYMKDVEYVLLFRKGEAFQINNCGEKTSCIYPNPKGKIHETEKPVALMEKFIRNSSQPGQIVLDPFCGSGSTLEAARRLGRRSIGIDMDESKCETAARRLSTGLRLSAKSEQIPLLQMEAL